MEVEAFLNRPRSAVTLNGFRLHRVDHGLFELRFMDYHAKNHEIEIVGDADGAFNFLLHVHMCGGEVVEALGRKVGNTRMSLRQLRETLANLQRKLEPATPKLATVG